MKSFFISCLAVALSFTQPSFAQDKLSLKLNLQPGSSYLYSLDMDQTNTQTVEGAEQKLNNETLMVWDYDVLEKAKGDVATVKVTYKRVKVSQNYEEQTATYDSDNPPDFVDPSMRGLAALPGTELVAQITSSGDVVSIQGVDKMLDKMIQALDLPKSPQKDQMVENLRKQFGADAVEQAIEQITAFYPSKPVGVGDMWNKSAEISSGFPMEVESNYILKSRKDGKAVIDVNSQISSDPKDAMSMGPLTMAYDIDGTQNGQITVDEKTGLPLKSEISMQFSGNVNVSGVPDEEAQSWPISASGNVIVTFTEQPK